MLPALLLFLSEPARGSSDDPAHAGGASEPTLYQTSGLDSVNLYNGALNVSIPLGGKYTVDGGYTYGFGLYLTTDMWYEDMQTCNGHPDDFEVEYSEPRWDGDLIGLGWRIVLPAPRLQSIFGQDFDLIVGDGSSHNFLLRGNTVAYTEDGSYLRLRELVAQREWAVDFPDGSTAYYKNVAVHHRDIRFQSMVDARGNTVLSYDYSTPGQIDIVDAAGRVHTWVLGSAMELRLAKFGGGHATYQFVRSGVAIERLSGGSHCEGATVDVQLLEALVLPDGSRFSFEQYTEKSTLLETPPEPFSPEYGKSGHLKSMTLPTGGRYEWRYSRYSVGNSSGHRRVVSKRIYEREGAEPSIWRYREDGYKVIVREPDDPDDDSDGNESVHYFWPEGVADTEGLPGYRYEGLPFSATEATTVYSNRTPSYRLYLSSEVFDGPADTGTKLRSSYVRYEVDPPFVPLPFNGNKIFNKRHVASMTIYHDDDDYAVETLNSDYDGFGNHRQSERWDSTAPTAVEVRRTNFNPHLDGLALDEVQRWLLSTYDSMETSYADQVSRSEYCFDTDNGFLKRTRTLRDFGTDRGANDLIVSNTMEFVDGLPTGNVARVDRYGADLEPLEPPLIGGELCSDTFESSLAALEPGSREVFTYQNGVVKTSNTLDPSTGAVELKGIDQDLDSHTGLVSTSRDPAGVATTYAYDAQGRMTSRAVVGLPTATITYCLKSDPSCTSNKVSRLTTAGGETLDDSSTFFDGLGRKVETRSVTATESAGSETLKTLYRYDLLDRLVNQTVTEPEPNLHGSRRTLFSYDALGRRVSVRRPDNTTTSYSYAGDRSSTTSYEVRTVDGDQTFSQVAITDPVRGLLTSVEEPSGSDGAPIETTYLYDVNHRLTQVKTGSQTRSFDYDNLGWLYRADHVELTAPSEFSLFDVRGNAGLAKKGTREVLSSFDPAGRVTLQSEKRGAVTRPFVELTYAHANDGDDRRAGKLARAKRHNYIPVDPYSPESSPEFHFVVTERYGYEHAAGLMTDLATTVVSFDDTGTTHDRADLLFEQRNTYDAAGRLSTLTYPSAARVNGPDTSFDTSLDYHRDQLVSIHGGTETLASFGYSRRLDSWVDFGNETRQSFVLAGSGIPRIGSISLARGAEQLWGTGDYAWDGSGNIRAIGDDTFEYDGVHRLTSGKVSSLLQTASFDQYGNITNLTTAGESSNISVDPETNRLSDVPGITFDYDSFGNITQWGGRPLVYDTANMVTASHFGDSPRYFIYGPDNRRIGTQKGSSGDVFWTIRGSVGKVLSEFRSSGGELVWDRDYVYRGSSLVAARHPDGAADGLRFFHLDHLESTRLVTDEIGDVVAEYDYFPFGGFAAKSGAEADLETHLFTGHERDANTTGDPADDLDYMMARYYAPHLGRFLSVDPVLGQAASPQSWNRYAYARNSPISLVDPDGKAPVPPEQRDSRRQISKTDLDDMTNYNKEVYGGGVANVCEYCGDEVSMESPRTGKKSGQFDHVVSHASGGRSTPGNIVLSCGECNGRSEKGSKELGAETTATTWRPSQPNAHVRKIMKNAGIVGFVLTLVSSANQAQAEGLWSVLLDVLPSAENTSESASATMLPPTYSDAIEWYIEQATKKKEQEELERKRGKVTAGSN